MRSIDSTTKKDRDLEVDTSTGGLLVKLAAAAGLALDATLAAMSAKLPGALGRLAAAASMSVALSNEDKTALDAIATQTTAAASLAAIKQLSGFETNTAINYSGGDQTTIADGSNGIWVNTAGTLKIDTWMGATGVTFTVIVGLFPQRRVKKIYQTGSSAAGYIGYPPA